MQLSPHAEIVLIEGPDAAAFAHAQFSSKVDALDVGHWQFSAWLDAAGRVRALFHLARLDRERYLLLLRGGSATAMAEALRRFVFRSKLTLTVPAGRTLASGPPRALHKLAQDGDCVSLGCGSHSLDVLTTHENLAARERDDTWRLLQLREGWPWLAPSTLDALLPAALSLQRLNAVAVDKGCYPGQEIVARLHFRGGHKRHLHRGVATVPLQAGAVLRVEGREVGCVVDIVAGEGQLEVLLVLSDEFAPTELDDTQLVFDGQLAVTLRASWPA